jgi:hypothetical protein
MEKRQRLADEYKYPGFRPLSIIRNHPGFEGARIITLQRRQKKQSVEIADRRITHFMIGKSDSSETCLAAMPVSILRLKLDE